MRRSTLVALGAGFGLVVGGRAVWRRLRLVDLTGQVVFITGGSRGLGLALAEEFARLGARIAICARDADELARARDYLAQRGASVVTFAGDVSDRQQMSAMIGEATYSYGRIDILVNNAGVISAGPLAALALDDFEQAMAIMFWGTVYATFAVLPQMRARRAGQIVNITSIGGRVSVPHLLPYASAKLAAEGFSEGLRTELASDGIAVTTVAPGLMRTGSYINALFKGAHAQEYALFSLLDNLPGSSIAARRAARQIVRAVRARQPEFVVTAPAWLADRFHGLFPGATQRLLSGIARLLPSGQGDPDAQQARRGYESETAFTRSPLFALGHSAARRYNEYRPGESPATPR